MKQLGISVEFVDAFMVVKFFLFPIRFYADHMKHLRFVIKKTKKICHKFQFIRANYNNRTNQKQKFHCLGFKTCVQSPPKKQQQQPNQFVQYMANKKIHKLDKIITNHNLLDLIKC